MVLHYSDELLIIKKIAKSQPQWNVWYSVHLARSTRLHGYCSHAVIRFFVALFTARLSEPRRPQMQYSTTTTCLAVASVSDRFLPISNHYTSVSCLMTCREIANRTFISAALLLSVVTIDDKNLNLSTQRIVLSVIGMTHSSSHSVSSPNSALMFSCAGTWCCNSSQHRIMVVSCAYSIILNVTLINVQ